jgi:hypothetical protein
MNEYIWVAYYSDGTKVSEIKEDGSSRDSREIDRSKLKTFQLFDGEVLKYSLTIHEKQRFIFRRRKTINLNSQLLEIVYVVGFQFNDETGKNYKVINYVHSGGLIELDDDRKDIVILPEEE